MKSSNDIIYGIIISFIKVLAIAIVAMFIYGELMYPDERNFVDTTTESFNDGWVRIMTDTTEEPVVIPSQVEPEGRSDMIKIKRTIKTWEDRDAFVSFNTAKQDIIVYVGDDLRYTYSTKDTRPVGTSSADIECFIPIYPSDNGKTMIIIFQGHNNYCGVLSEMTLGTQVGIALDIMSKDYLDIIGALGLMFMGILSVALAMFIRAAYKKRAPIGFLGLGVFFAGFWMIAESNFRQFLVPNFSVMANMTYLSIMIIPLAFAIYLDSIQEGRYRIIYLLICMLGIVESVVSITLQLTQNVDLVESLLYSFVLCGIDMVTFLVGSVYDIYKKRLKTYKTEFIGIIGGIIAGLITILSYYNRPTKINGSILCVGFLFVVLMSYMRSFRDVLLMERTVNAAHQAQDASREFLTRMSHEIRTPINAILGMNKMILKESDDNEILEYARDVNGAGNYLLSVVNELLDLSKVNTGTIDLRCDEYDIIEMIRECYALVAPRARASRLSFSVEMDDILPAKLYGDKERIEQIIVNLINNSIKHTPEGHIIFSITGKIKEGKLWLIFTISDTGIGIPEDRMDSLFDVFQQMDDFEARSMTSTGIGLAVSKRLVELMDGKISVESTVGKGTDFTVIIPQGIRSTEPCGNFSMGSNGDRRVLNRQEKLNMKGRILVVDDVAINLRVFSVFLKNTNITVDTAKSGKEALEMVENTKYDLIFLDHLMPGMDGIETKKLMECLDNNKSQGAPIVMQTANAVVGAKEKYLALGFADYIAKPIKEEELIGIIKKYMS